MNKKIIEELKQQAQTVVGEGLGGNYYDLDPDVFAELIIRKCADLCTDSYYTPDGFGYTTSDARCHDLILKHFGVE